MFVGIVLLQLTLVNCATQILDATPLSLSDPDDRVSSLVPRTFASRSEISHGDRLYFVDNNFAEIDQQFVKDLRRSRRTIVFRPLFVYKQREVKKTRIINQMQPSSTSSAHHQQKYLTNRPTNT